MCTRPRPLQIDRFPHNKTQTQRLFSLFLVPLVSCPRPISQCHHVSRKNTRIATINGKISSYVFNSLYSNYERNVHVERESQLRVLLFHHTDTMVQLHTSLHQVFLLILHRSIVVRLQDLLASLEILKSIPLFLLRNGGQSRLIQTSKHSHLRRVIINTLPHY